MSNGNALVTGASRGIGRAITLALAGEGLAVLAAGRDADALQQTCRLAARAGGEARPFTCDLREDAALPRMVAEAAGQQGLDVVVHNAGVGDSGLVAEALFDRWDRILQVNLRAPMLLSAHALPEVIRRQGVFVFIGSISARMGQAGGGAYAASKHGLDGFAQSLFEEVREQGVRVVRIHPGFVNTEMLAGRNLAAAKMIQPEDVARLVIAAVEMPPSACVVEMVVRPQRTPYL
jgi:3-oxoacyl-[acyl-carrier protein] reductase